MIFRNNNPGNIRSVPGIPWIGETGTDYRGFVIFDTPQHGTRAMIKLLSNYNSQGFDTLREIVYRWAPPNENDSAGYLNTVSNLTGLNPDSRISFTEPATIYNLVAGMSKMEQGINMPLGIFSDAWNLLFGSGSGSIPVPGDQETGSGSFWGVLAALLPFIGFGYIFYRITSKNQSK